MAQTLFLTSSTMTILQVLKAHFFKGAHQLETAATCAHFRRKKKKRERKKGKKEKRKKKTCTDYLSKLSKNELPVGLVIQFQ